MVLDDASGPVGFFEAQARARRLILLSGDFDDGVRRLALLMLEFASAATWDAQRVFVCWPSMETLTRLTGWNTRMVQRRRAALAKIGAFSCIRQGGRGGSARWAMVPPWLAATEAALVDAGALDSFGRRRRIFKDDAIHVALTPPAPAASSKGDNLAGGQSKSDNPGVVQAPGGGRALKGDQISVAHKLGEGVLSADVIPISVDNSVDKSVGNVNAATVRATTEPALGVSADAAAAVRATTPLTPEVVEVNNKNITARVRGDGGKPDRRQRSLPLMLKIAGGKPDRATPDRATTAAGQSGASPEELAPIMAALAPQVSALVAQTVQATMAAALPELVAAVLSREARKEAG